MEEKKPMNTEEVTSFSARMKTVIDELKSTNINGCITGSSMMNGDFDSWSSKPDIDIFVYSEPSFIHAVDIIQYRLGFVPGKGGATNLAEEWKLDRARTYGSNKKNGAKLSTTSLMRDDVIVNVTYKYNKTNLFDVLGSFDMSIVMIGYDIPRGVLLDLRDLSTIASTGRYLPIPNDKNVAVPNPLRKQDAAMYNVEAWIRQFGRVIKYWDRGYDTRPMASFYLSLIDSCLEIGPIFSSEAAKELWAKESAEFLETRDKIERWIKDKEDL